MIEASLMLLLTTWCDRQFLDKDGGQNYKLDLRLVAPLATLYNMYNMDNWYCWITIQGATVTTSLQNGSTILQTTTWRVVDVSSEEIVRWCIDNMPEVYQD